MITEAITPTRIWSLFPSSECIVRFYAAREKVSTDSLPCKACYVPHLLLDTGALKTTGGKAEVPSLDKEGWVRPLRKCQEASFSGRRRGSSFKPPIIGS